MKKYNHDILLIILAVIICVLSMISVALTAHHLVGVAEAEPVQESDVVQETDVVQEDPAEPEKIEQAIDWHEMEDVLLTAFCPCELCCGEWADGITYTGVKAQQGVTIAVDPDVIPLGAWVEIYGTQFHAEDIGGAIQGNRIDIYFDNHEDAEEFGVHRENVRWYADETTLEQR